MAYRHHPTCSCDFNRLQCPQAKQEAAEASEADLTDPAASEAGGFVFSRLIERRPAHKPELLLFRDALLAAASQEQTLKVCMFILETGSSRSVAGRMAWGAQGSATALFRCYDDTKAN